MTHGNITASQITLWLDSLPFLSEDQRRELAHAVTDYLLFDLLPESTWLKALILTGITQMQARKPTAKDPARSERMRQSWQRRRTAQQPQPEPEPAKEPEPEPQKAPAKKRQPRVKPDGQPLSHPCYPQFAAAHAAYPGQKQSPEREWARFSAAIPTADLTPDTLHRLAQGIDRLVSWRAQATAADQWMPQLPRLSRWLAERRWDETYPEITPKTSNNQHYATTKHYLTPDDRREQHQREFQQHILAELYGPQPAPNACGIFG